MKKWFSWNNIVSILTILALLGNVLMGNLFGARDAKAQEVEQRIVRLENDFATFKLEVRQSYKDIGLKIDSIVTEMNQNNKEVLKILINRGTK